MWFEVGTQGFMVTSEAPTTILKIKTTPQGIIWYLYVDKLQYATVAFAFCKPWYFYKIWVQEKNKTKTPNKNLL